MNVRTINDPSALGWVQDPVTGRWVWQSSSGGGGDGGTSGPISTGMIATETADLLPWLADPSELRTQKDVNRYLNEKIDTFQETDPTVSDHVKAITPTQIASWDAGTGAGGGAGPDPRISDTQISNWDEAFSWGDWSTGGGGGGSGVDPGTSAGQMLRWDGSDWKHTSKVMLDTHGMMTIDSGKIVGDECGLHFDAVSEAILPVGGDGKYSAFIDLGDSSNKFRAAKFSGRIDCGSLYVNGQQITSGGGGGGGFSGSYNDLTDKPTIPTNNNQLSNGAGYITSSSLSGYAPASHTHSQYLTSSSLNGYATTSYAYSKAESDNKYELKGAGGGGTPTFQEVSAAGSTTNQSMTAPNWWTQKDGYTLGGDGGGACARIVILNGFTVTSKTGATTLQVSEAGVATATDFTASSDRNLKEHIETAPTGVVDKLRGVTFQWKEDGRESSGVIAQEVQDAGLGHLVDENDNGLAVNYNGLVAYLIEEIKDLKAQVEALK